MRRSDLLLVVVAAGAILAAGAARAADTSLRFFGHGSGDIDRVKIPIDAPARPTDVGGDFTLEFWMKATPGENTASGCSPGNDNWITGHVIFDRDVYGAGDYGDFGVSLFTGGIAFGAAGTASGGGLCGATPVDDGAWHHVAVTRASATGQIRLFVDGAPDGSATAPTGDLSYRDGRSGFPNDPYLVIGAEKHDAGAAYPSFAGWVDEVRLSNVVRYAAAFAPPTGPFTTDASTVGLWHFDEGPAGPCTGAVLDASGAGGGPSDGACSHGGGGTSGPRYSTDVPAYGGPLSDLLAEGRSLVVRDHATKPAQRKLSVTSSDAGIVPPLPGGGEDPSVAGALLVLGRGGDEVASIALPAALWKGLGAPAGARGWRYADPQHASGPCTRVVVKQRSLVASCSGALLPFTLDEPSQGTLAVSFTPGSGRRTCLAFGGVVTKDVSTAPGPVGLFRARGAPAPSACPLP